MIELWEVVSEMVRPDCSRLEGFKDPWETTVFKGRMMLPDKTLEECGVPSGAQLISVRRVLVPEGDSAPPHFADSFVPMTDAHPEPHGNTLQHASSSIPVLDLQLSTLRQFQPRVS